MALKIVKKGRVTCKSLDLVSKRSELLLALDEKAGLASALDSQIKEEQDQLKEMKNGVREMVSEVGVRQPSGTVTVETPRFEIMDQLRTQRLLDREALERWMDNNKNTTLKGRVFKAVTVIEIDEPEMVRLVTEGHMTENELKAFYSSKETRALVIKAKEGKK